MDVQLYTDPESFGDQTEWYACAHPGCKRETMGYADDIPDGWVVCPESLDAFCPHHLPNPEVDQ